MKQLTIVTALLCALLIQTVSAQKQTPPPGGKAKDFKLSARNDKTYPNGLKSTLVQYGAIPKVNVSLIIKTGNVHEGANEVWLSDLTGRLLKEGTTGMNFAALSKKAAQMGGELNVSVGMTQTTISGSVLSEYAPEFIKLVADLVMNPAFPASELERLKGDLKRQLAVQKAVPQAQAQEQFFGAIYKDHPYGRMFPTEDMINSYTLPMVKDFYGKNFGARRSVLYVVGKFNEAPVNAAIAAAFSKWKAGPPVQYPPVQASAVTDTMMIERKGAPQTTVMVGLPVPTPEDKDYLPMLVTNSLLGGSFGSRITSNIRENKGYTYSPFSTVANRKGSSLWYEVADVTSEHTIDALWEIEKEVKRLQMEPPSKEELQGIQNYEAGIFVLRNSSPAGIISQLNFLDLYGLNDNYLTNYIKNMYAVTPEKVSEMVQKHVQYDKMTKVMVGDKELIRQQMEKHKATPKPF
jgi:predicted Zn-dependent peptidase